MGRTPNNSQNPRLLENSVTQTVNVFMQGGRNHRPSRILAGTRDFLFVIFRLLSEGHFILCWGSCPLLLMSCHHRSGKGCVTSWEKGEVFDIIAWWAWARWKGQGHQPAILCQSGTSDINLQIQRRVQNSFNSNMEDAHRPAFLISNNADSGHRAPRRSESWCWVHLEVWKHGHDNV